VCVFLECFFGVFVYLRREYRTDRGTWSVFNLLKGILGIHLVGF